MRDDKRANREANVDRQTNIDPNNPLGKVEFAEEMPKVKDERNKYVSNYTETEKYFRQKSKETINKDYLENMLEETNI